MLHPDVFWYRLNGMGTQKHVTKKVLVTLFPYIFHIKSKWNIVYKYFKTKIFSRNTTILPQMHWTSNIFGPSAKIFGGFWVSLIYPIRNFKKTVCPKNFWLQHWRWNLMSRKLCTFACCRLMEKRNFKCKLKYFEAPKQAHLKMKNISQTRNM